MSFPNASVGLPAAQSVLWQAGNPEKQIEYLVACSKVRVFPLLSIAFD
jgi:hypothetical protein